MNKLLLIFGLILSGIQVNAQLAPGSPAPDFTVTDINGQPYSLYAKMGNKGACIAFEATWCGLCWQFHEDGVLQSIYNNLSADATTIFFESDFSTNTACLYGPMGCNSSTHGDWVSGSPYQIVDLSPSNGPNVKDDYQQNYWPMLYVISPDKRAWEVKTLVYSEFSNWLTKSFKLNTTATITNCNCGDNGKIVLNVTGGFGSLSYKWSNGDITKDLNNIPGGVYSVTITDQNGYFKTFGPWNVTNPPKQVDVTSAQLTPVKCYNESTGSIEIQTAYGTPPYTYYWSNGKATKNIDNLKAGNYILTVTDNVGCTRMKSYSIIQPAELIVTTTSGKEDCDEMNAFISIKAIGGTPPYHYDIGFGSQQIPTFNDLNGGKTYNLTVTDDNACTRLVKITIDVTHKPKASAGPTKAFVDCIKESLLLDGSKSSQGSNLSYQWTTTDGNILHGAETLYPEINKPGIYNLKVTDLINKCADAESILVTDQRRFPNIHADGDTTLNCILIQTLLTGKSDSLPVIYYWKKAYDSLFYQNEKNLVTSDSGIYIFYVKDTLNSCISKDSVIVLSDQIKPVAQTHIQSDLSCNVKETTIDGSASSQGPSIKYQWSTVDGNIIGNKLNQNVNVNKGGDYMLLVENENNYCQQTSTAHVIQHTLLNPEFVQTIDNLTVQFNDLSAGIPDTWSWDFGDPGSSGNTSNEKNPQHTYSATGQFKVCLEVENDCGKTNTCHDVFLGIQTSLQIISWEIHQPQCFGENTGSIELNIQGGIPPYSFLWSNQETSKDIKGLSAGTYSVQIKDQQGTVINKNFEIIQPLDILLNHADITNTSSGQNIGSVLLNMEGNELYSYLWSDGQTTNPIQNLAAGDYFCTVTNSNNCTKSFGPFNINEITATNSADKDENNTDDLIAFNIQPNPVNSNGIIALKFSKDKSYQIDIVNLYGSVVWSNKLQNSEIHLTIDMSNFQKAVYLVVLKTEHNRKILKWIVD